jgi:hypothetical protein
MRRWLRVPCASRDERGTSLVLALAFMTLFGVGAAMLAQFGAASFQTVKAVRDQRASVYAAQGAVDTAIDYVRGNSGLGTNGGPCLTAAAPLSMPAVAGHTIDATCTGQTPAGGGGSSSGNFPSQALLTLATGSEVGVNVGSFFTGTTHFGGPVFSNSGIAANQLFGQGALDAGTFPVTARGPCTGTITGTPVACNVGAGGHPEGNDPNYPSPLSTIPARQTVPACPAAANKIVTFNPGFYDDEAALTNLTDGHCANAVLWFKPGAYYFDFDLASTGNVWQITDPSINIVGGTPKGWSTTSATRPPIPAPGACKTDTDPTPNDGVQFVWGGDSQWLFVAGNTELCASPDANGRELVLYGQKTGTTAPTSATLKATGGTASPAWPTPLTPSTAVNAIDGAVTTANLSGKNATGLVTSTGYNASAIPGGSLFGSVQLKVAHSESTPASVSTLTATVNGTGASCAVPVTARTVTGTDTYNVPCITSLAQLSGLNVAYKGQLIGTGSATPTSALNLDGIEVVVNYTPPALRAQFGCILVPGGFLAQSSGACSMVALTSLFGGSFYLNGTVYAPLARLDLELTFSTKVQVTRGMIARAVGLWDPPGISQINTNISVPPALRSVVFLGRVDGVRRVRAVVDFTDTPAPGSQAVVAAWSVSR